MLVLTFLESVQKADVYTLLGCLWDDQITINFLRKLYSSFKIDVNCDANSMFLCCYFGELNYVGLS